MTVRSRRGFTITELLVIIGVVVLLLGLLFPALGAFRRSGLMAGSMANMRQIGAWMKLYSDDNRDAIVPSQFNYSTSSYPGKVRSVVQGQAVGDAGIGTWADILWTVFKLGPVPGAETALGNSYEFDSPDEELTRWAEDTLGSGFHNPLRSMAVNSRDFRSSHDLATPWGPGAGEKGLAGYFAANNFFNSDPACYDWRDPAEPTPPARWYHNAQIRMPEKSVYLVDSFGGEIIQPWAVRWEVTPPTAPGQVPDPSECMVDFRYNDSCLMLMLDGHAEPVSRWDTIDDLEGPASLGLRIRNLDQR